MQAADKKTEIEVRKCISSFFDDPCEFVLSNRPTRPHAQVAVTEIPNDNELRDDLTGPQYGFDDQERIQLEKKKDTKARGLVSPNAGDSLAITFTYPAQVADSTILRPEAARRRPDMKAFS